MITKNVKSSVITEICLELPALDTADRARICRMLSDTFAVSVADRSDSEKIWKLRAELPQGSDAMDSMAYTVSVSLPMHEILIEAGSVPALWEGIGYLFSRIGATALPENGRLSMTVSSFAYSKNYRETPVDNSRILPMLHSDRAVEMLTAGPGMTDVLTPDWLSDMVMVEVHLETAARDGSFRTAAALVDFYAAAGVNAIRLCPIYNRDKNGDGYSNRGLHTIDSAYTGCADPADGWNVVRKFIDYAHRRQVRILMDVVSFGVMASSPICAGHPEWFADEANSQCASRDGQRTFRTGLRTFRWENPEFRAWFVDKAVENLMYTHADGYCCDGEPYCGGYDVWREVRRRAYAAGRKIILIAGERCEKNGVFDLGKDGAENVSDIFKRSESTVCDCTRFPLYTVSDHNCRTRSVAGNRLKIGYEALLAPCVPVWFCGDEIGMRDGAPEEQDKANETIYFSKIRWELLESPANRIFFEDVKQMLRLRRMFPDIFAFFPEDHRKTNMLAVPCVCAGVPSLTGYLRKGRNRAVLVIPAAEDGVYTCSVPAFADSDTPVTVTDIFTNRLLYDGPASGFTTLRLPLRSARMGLYYIEMF